MQDVIAGIVWAAANATAQAAAAASEYATTGRTSRKGSVINISLGGGKSRALEDTINQAVDAGVHFAVAAGVFHFGIAIACL